MFKTCRRSLPHLFHETASCQRTLSAREHFCFQRHPALSRDMSRLAQISLGPNWRWTQVAPLLTLLLAFAPLRSVSDGTGEVVEQNHPQLRCPFHANREPKAMHAIQSPKGWPHSPSTLSPLGQHGPTTLVGERLRLGLELAKCHPYRQGPAWTLQPAPCCRTTVVGMGSHAAHLQPVWMPTCPATARWAALRTSHLATTM